MRCHRHATRRCVLALSWMTALATVLLAGVLESRAQEWPKAQPIRILVGFAAGGGNDVFARLVGQRLSEKLGQTIVIENRTGAGSIIAFEAAARAAPDGYTLLVAPFGATIINPAVYAKLPYDQAQLLPLSIVASFPFVLVVRSDSGIDSVEDLVKAAKAAPDKANYGVPSVTFQLLGEQLKARTGAPFVHIPFRGTNEVLQAMLSGQLMMSFVDPGPLVGHLKGGRVKALAHSGSTRFALIPDVPTLEEVGLKGVVMDSFMGFMAQRGLAEPIARRLEAELVAMAKDKDFADRILQHGLVPVGSTAQEFAERVAREIPLWKLVADKAGIKLQ